MVALEKALVEAPAEVPAEIPVEVAFAAMPRMATAVVEGTARAVRLQSRSNLLVTTTRLTAPDPSPYCRCSPCAP